LPLQSRFLKIGLPFPSLVFFFLNTSQNIILKKNLYKIKPITWGPKFVKLLYYIMNLNTISSPWQAMPTKNENKTKVYKMNAL